MPGTFLKISYLNAHNSQFYKEQKSCYKKNPGSLSLVTTSTKTLANRWLKNKLNISILKGYINFDVIVGVGVYKSIAPK